MIDTPPVVAPSPSVLAPVAPGGGVRGTARFGQTLSAFLDARDAAAGSSAPPAAGDDRQADADNGTDLPPAPDDPPFPAPPLAAWLLAIPLPVAAGVQTADAAPTIAATAAHVPAAASDIASATQSPPAALVATTVSVDPLGVPGTSAPIAALLAAQSVVTVTGVPDAANKRAGPADDTAAASSATPPAVPSAIVPSAIPQPARQVFAAALAAAPGWRERPARLQTTDPVTVAASLPSHAAIPASNSPDGAPLDLRDDRGLQQVIDRIETLRDASADDAVARDTHIRLVPDALGGVDIAVRQTGNRLQVHFTAERAATQALLLDAQPRLADLAAARGVRIHETSVSAGTASGDGFAQRPTAQPPRSTRNALAAAPAETPELSDTRLA